MGLEPVRTYQEHPSFSGLVLEESYVLDIECHPGRVVFTMDLVLAPDHPGYAPPRQGEAYAYRRGFVHFARVTECAWTLQGGLPAIDASGELDYGHIDALEWEASNYALEGDWGQMNLIAGDTAVSFDGA